MARVSSAPEDAFHFKGTFEDGWAEVIGAKALVFQYPPSKEARGDRPAGHQDPPGLFACLELQRHVDGDGNKAGTPPEEVLLSIQRASKDTGMLDACHPGNYPEGDTNADPGDCGGDLGSEGNTLFAVADGYQLNDKTKWMAFTQSLQEKGFKPAILKRTYFPDLIGLRAYFKTETRKKFRDDQTADPTVFAVTEIKQFPYEKGAAKPVATTKDKPGPKSQPTTVAPAATSSSATLGAEDIASAIVTTTLTNTQKGHTLNDGKKLRVLALMAINLHKPAVPPALKKAVIDCMTEDWLTAIATAHDLIDVADDGKITFK